MRRQPAWIAAITIHQPDIAVVGECNRAVVAHIRITCKSDWIRGSGARKGEQTQQSANIAAHGGDPRSGRWDGPAGGKPVMGKLWQAEGERQGLAGPRLILCLGTQQNMV